MKISEFIKENNIPKYNKWKEHYTLNDEEFQLLVEAVNNFLPTKLKNVNYNTNSSYGLKHIFERFLGFYISNYDLKIVMQYLGYKSAPYRGYYDDINLYYNISKKEVDRARLISEVC